MQLLFKLKSVNLLTEKSFKENAISLMVTDSFSTTPEYDSFYLKETLIATESNIIDKLESLFAKLQENDELPRSLSVGDTVDFNDQKGDTHIYLCKNFGWEKVSEESTSVELIRFNNTLYQTSLSTIWEVTLGLESFAGFLPTEECYALLPREYANVNKYKGKLSYLKDLPSSLKMKSSIKEIMNEICQRDTNILSE